MKRAFITFSALFLAISLFTSCSKDSQNPSSLDEKKQETVDLAFSADLEDVGNLRVLSAETGEPVADDKLRMFFDDRGVGNGVAFTYENGERIKAVLVFKKGSQTHVEETLLEIKSHENGKYKVVPKSLNIPRWLTTPGEPLYVSGAIGVTHKGNNSSRVSVLNPGKMIANGQKYSVPMYFPRTEIGLDTRKLSFFAKFALYGSLVALEVNNDHRTKYRLRELDIVSEVFDTEGEMELNVKGEPTWHATQRTGSKKTVELIARNSEFTINRGESRYFAFWVKPTAQRISRHNNTVKIGLKSFRTTNKPASVDAGLADITYRVEVNNPLQEGRVHRVPTTLEAPLPGDLIITEVFRGALPGNVAIEVYNSSDEEINLADYSIRSYSPNKGEQTSPLIKADFRHLKVLVDNRKGTAYGTSVTAPRISYSDYSSGYYKLKPREMAVFVSMGLIFDKWQMQRRSEGLKYVFNFQPENNEGFKLYAHGYVELLNRDEEVVDVFLKMNNGGVPQAHDAWSYTMMRKPDRNTPRQTMKQGSNSDWVARDRTENIDWGYRFGYEYGNRPDPRSANNIWFDGQHEQFNGMLEIGTNGRPLLYLNTDPNHAGFLRSWEDKNTRLVYTVPERWTRSSGIAH